MLRDRRDPWAETRSLWASAELRLGSLPRVPPGIAVTLTPSSPAAQPALGASGHCRQSEQGPQAIYPWETEAQRSQA